MDAWGKRIYKQAEADKRLNKSDILSESNLYIFEEDFYYERNNQKYAW